MSTQGSPVVTCKGNCDAGCSAQASIIDLNGDTIEYGPERDIQLGNGLDVIIRLSVKIIQGVKFIDSLSRLSDQWRSIWRWFLAYREVGNPTVYSYHAYKSFSFVATLSCHITLDEIQLAVACGYLPLRATLQTGFYDLT